jgi:hypothetical protein
MAAALPKSPICALKLGDRTSLTGVSRGLSAGLRCACSTSVTAPPVRFGEVVKPGRFSAQSKRERESRWAFQVFLSVKNIDLDSPVNKLESAGPILLLFLARSTANKITTIYSYISYKYIRHSP